MVPKQDILYIGRTFHFQQEIETPTPERIKKLVFAIKNLCRGQNRSKDFLHLLGIMASFLELIPNAQCLAPHETYSVTPTCFFETIIDGSWFQ